MHYNTNITQRTDLRSAVHHRHYLNAFMIVSLSYDCYVFLLDNREVVDAELVDTALIDREVIDR